MDYNKYNVFCTLFDSNYLDKGLALYKSLTVACERFKLYIFAFDDTAFNVLKELKLENVVVIHRSEFETKELLSVKQMRSAGEYCWTCTPYTIFHVITEYNEPCCTYIDADMYFYKNPIEVFAEMDNAKAEILIVEHRFPQKTYLKNVELHGKYCVEFNTFFNTPNGMACLEWWKKSCLECCHYSRNPKETVGDQTYLESFDVLFGNVLSTTNIGMGVAPWNCDNYEYTINDNSIQVKENDVINDLIFYHFQNIRYLSNKLININLRKNNRFIKENLYIPYLSLIEKIRRFLFNEYSIKFTIKKSVYKNKLLRFIQNYIMPFKIRTLSNLLSKRRLEKNDSMQ